MEIQILEDYLKTIDFENLDLEQLYQYIKCVTEIEKTKFEIKEFKED